MWESLHRLADITIYCECCVLWSLHSQTFGDLLCGRWPKTLAGILAFVPCAATTFGSAPHPSGNTARTSSEKVKKAWRRCDRAGRWAEEDYTQCPYASEMTRMLHELTQVLALHRNHSHVITLQQIRVIKFTVDLRYSNLLLLYCCSCFALCDERPCNHAWVLHCMYVFLFIADNY